MGYLGSSALSAIKFGSSAVSKVYRGAALLWAAFAGDPVRLLLHMDETAGTTTFNDSSLYTKSVVVNGDAAMSNLQSPTFASTSGAFDGTGDYLRVPYDSSLSIGTDPCTVEFWVYMNNRHDAWFIDIGGTSRHLSIGYYTLNNGWSFFSSDNGSTVSSNVITDGTPEGAWHHIAMTFDGSAVWCYKDGVYGGSYVETGIFDGGADLYIGAYNGGTQRFLNGYLSDLRITHGTALYTGSGSFTPPDKHPDPGVLLANGTLFHFSEASDSTDFANKGDQRGGGYSDGNSKVSNLQAKFGTTSFFSDSVNSGKGYLRASSIPDLAASDFTIDFWMRGDGDTAIANGPAYLASHNEFDTQNAWAITYFNGIRFNYSTDGGQGTNTTFTNGSWTFPADTWQHVAIVREGNTLRCFLDGVEASQTGDMTGVTIYKSPSPLRLGHRKSLGSENSFFDGYLDEIRIILEASYTTNFTPPTAEYADWVDPFTGVTTSFEPGELQFANPTTGETPAVSTTQAQEDEYSWQTIPQNGANAGAGERLNTGLDMTKRYDCYSIWTWCNQDLIDTTGNYRMIIAGTLDDGILGDGWCLYTRATGYGLLHTGSNFVPGIGAANLSTLAANTWHHHYLQIDWGSNNPDKTQRSNFNISIWTNGTAVATNFAVSDPFPATFGQNNGLDAWQLAQGVSPGGGGNAREHYYDKLIAHTADTAPLTPGTNYTTAEIEAALLAF